MKKITIIALLFSLFALIVGCPGILPVIPGDPVSIDLSGTKGLFLESGNTSRAAGGADTVLMKVLEDSTTESATFLDVNGQPVDVTIDQAKNLNSSYMLVTYSTIYLTDTAVVDRETGQLYSITTVPDRWDQIREKDNKIYYVSGSTLLRIDIPAMTETVLNPPEYSVTSSAYLYVNTNGSTAHMYMSGDKRFWLFSAAGVLADDMSGQPEAERFFGAVKEDASGTSVFVVEDYDTQDLFYIRPESSNVAAQKIIFSEDHGITTEAESIIHTYSTSGTYTRLGNGPIRFDNSVFTNDDKCLKLSYNAGAISVTNYDQSTELNNYSWLPDGKYRSGKVYASYDYLSTVKIREMDITGVSAAEKVLADRVGITEFEVIEDQLFFTEPTGVYKHDIASGVTSLYADVSAIKSID